MGDRKISKLLIFQGSNHFGEPPGVLALASVCQKTFPTIIQQESRTMNDERALKAKGKRQKAKGKRQKAVPHELRSHPMMKARLST